MNAGLLTVKLETMVYGGDALGRLPDGRPVFVPFGLPGETVRLRVREERRGHVRAELVEVLAPSPERIAPRCPHFGNCGGCHYQHLGYEHQVAQKTNILKEQLQRIGRIGSPPLGQSCHSAEAWNYRNQLQFHLTGEGKLGFVAVDGRSRLAVHTCHLPELSLAEVWPALEFEAGLEIERITLRLGHGGEMMLVLESPSLPGMEIEAGLSVVHLLGGQAVVLAGEPALEMHVNGRSFQVSADSFFQVNTALAGQMVTHLLERLPLTARTTLLEVYCGVGLFSAFLAGQVGRLVGVELSASACDDFTANLDEFDNVELYQAAAEQVLPGLALHPEIVLLDPPRAGLGRGVLESLLSLAPAWVAYVSCDPSTLGRDAARLAAGGYHLQEVRMFDLFPQTYHLESISIFARGE